MHNECVAGDGDGGGGLYKVSRVKRGGFYGRFFSLDKAFCITVVGIL